MKDYIKRDGKPDVIVIDKSKFTQEDLNDLELYRQLAIRIKVLYRGFYERYCNSETAREQEKWLNCMELIDQIRCNFDDEMFRDFPNLPDSAVKVFY
ncbi:MAG: hypothetical protein MR332_04200 [Fusicatenibacter sp.]|nr:hypothetical protein [Fusicatenibacter sp.]